MRVDLKRGTKITVVGDIHEHSEQFFNLIDEIKPSTNNILVSVGDIFDRGFGHGASSNILKTLIKLNSKGAAYMVRGNHEQKRRNKNVELPPEETWAINTPLSITFSFSNQSKIVVLHGGVLPKHTHNDLVSNTDVLYVRNLDENGKYIKVKFKDNKLQPMGGKPWHEMYDGRFGYIVAGHEPQTDGQIKFYPYSCNIDTACYRTGILSAVTFNEYGRERVIQINGNPARPAYISSSLYGQNSSI